MFFFFCFKSKGITLYIFIWPKFRLYSIFFYSIPYISYITFNQNTKLTLYNQICLSQTQQ